MALQSSGQITLDDIHVEAGGTTGTQASINDADIRGLVSATSGSEMQFSDWYGASSSASYVGSYTRQINDGDALVFIDSSTPIDLTTAGVQAGDLVVISITSDDKLDVDATFTGMTLTNLAGSTNLQSPGVILRYGIWQSGNSNPYVSSYTVGEGGRPAVVLASIFRNTNTSLLNSATATGTAGMPDSPSLSSVSGTKLIVSTGHLDDDFVASSAGSGYTLATMQAASRGATACSGAIQYKITSTSTTENPPAFGGTGSDQWWAATLRF